MALGPSVLLQDEIEQELETSQEGTVSAKYAAETTEEAEDGDTGADFAPQEFKFLVSSAVLRLASQRNRKTLIHADHESSQKPSLAACVANALKALNQRH